MSRRLQLYRSSNIANDRQAAISFVETSLKTTLEDGEIVSVRYYSFFTDSGGHGFVEIGYPGSLQNYPLVENVGFEISVSTTEPYKIGDYVLALGTSNQYICYSCIADASAGTSLTNTSYFTQVTSTSFRTINTLLCVPAIYDNNGTTEIKISYYSDINREGAGISLLCGRPTIKIPANETNIIADGNGLHLSQGATNIISNGVLSTTYINGFSPDFVQLQDPSQTDIIPSAPKPFVQVSGTQVTLACEAGVTYVCGSLNTLSFTLTASSYTDYTDEYDIIFTSPSTPTSITWPSGITFCGSSSAPTIEANASYEINIVNNLCIVANFGVNSGGGGSSTLSGLSDVNFTSLANGQIMEYDSNTSKWVNINKTTYSDFTGATSLVAGTNGLVPAPTTSDPDNYLKGDGTWASPVSVQFNNHTLQITT